jgi:nucleotide-binding universal stress UspA family protein
MLMPEVTEMTTKVLFATDGRPAAAAAAELLRRLLDPERVTMTILHADEYGNRAVADRYAESVLDEAVRAMRGAGIVANPLRVHMDAMAGIEEARAQEGSELTVVGAGNHSWLGGVVFGSISTHLLHHAAAPVLVVHRAPNAVHERLQVLVGVDGSPSVAAATRLLTSITDPARIDMHLCSVVVPAVVSVASHPGGVFLPQLLLDDLTAEGQEAAGRHLTEMREQLEAVGFKTGASRPEGPAPLALLDEASRLEADLAVVGARGLGPIGRLTVGSVSAHVARHAPATLVAHAPDQEA